MNSRRRLLVALGPAALFPRRLFAQSTTAPVLIGWLHFGSRESNGHLLAAFKEGLASVALKEGSRIVIEERWANGRRDQLPALAAELAAKKPAIIVAAPSASVAPAAKAAPAIPIVQASGGDPVAVGLVASLARPGGMITGLSNVVGDLTGKHLELLIETAPRLRHVGYLVDSAAMNRGVLMEAARRSIARHALDARFEEAGNPEEIEPAMSRLAKHGVQALIVLASPLFLRDRRRIVRFALAQGWPVIANGFEWAEAGALLNYGADVLANYRRAAYYVDRILKGAKPGDLPFEQPTKFELVVNLKTAAALGIAIPQSVMIQATRVIE